MSKKKGKKKTGTSNPTSGPQDSITLRQEITGKIQPKVSNNVKTYLNHFENLATWASGQASIPSLAAFFGQRLAAAAESSAAAPDPSLFLCQRCETVLQPGCNCSIRIEKNNAKRRRRHNKCTNLTQNNVVYYCHYCSCKNIKRGTPKGHMKTLYQTKFGSKRKLVDVKDGKKFETSVKTVTEILTIDTPNIPSTTRDILTNDAPVIPPTTGDILKTDARVISPPTDDIRAVDSLAILPLRTEDILTNDASATPVTSVTTLPESHTGKSSEKPFGPETSSAPLAGDIISIVDSPATPLTMLGMTLLSSNKRKRKKPSLKNLMESESSSAPTTDGDKIEGTSKSKRKKKSWTSLKEIAQTNEHGRKQNGAELAIPFSLQAFEVVEKDSLAIAESFTYLFSSLRLALSEFARGVLATKNEGENEMRMGIISDVGHFPPNHPIFFPKLHFLSVLLCYSHLKHLSSKFP